MFGTSEFNHSAFGCVKVMARAGQDFLVPVDSEFTEGCIASLGKKFGGILDSVKMSDSYAGMLTGLVNMTIDGQNVAMVVAKKGDPNEMGRGTLVMFIMSQ